MKIAEYIYGKKASYGEDYYFVIGCTTNNGHGNYLILMNKIYPHMVITAPIQEVTIHLH